MSDFARNDAQDKTRYSVNAVSALVIVRRLCQRGAATGLYPSQLVYVPVGNVHRGHGVDMTLNCHSRVIARRCLSQSLRLEIVASRPPLRPCLTQLNRRGTCMTIISTRTGEDQAAGLAYWFVEEDLGRHRIGWVTEPLDGYWATLPTSLCLYFFTIDFFFFFFFLLRWRGIWSANGGWYRDINSGDRRLLRFWNEGSGVLARVGRSLYTRRWRGLDLARLVQVLAECCGKRMILRPVIAMKSLHFRHRLGRWNFELRITLLDWTAAA